MRIGGIASGIDTESMIRDLMRAERMRMNKFLRQEQSLKWKQEAYNDVNKVMANFILNTRSNFGLTQVSLNGTLRSNSTNNLNWVKTATSSNEGIVSATARGDAMNGNHTVEVKKLASNAAFTSNNLIESGVIAKDSLTFTETVSITIQNAKGESEVITAAANDHISTFVSKINNAVNNDGESMGIRAAFDSNLGQIMIRNRDTGKDEITVTTNTVDFTGTSGDGTNAEILFNNQLVEMSTNNFTLFGIELNLRSVGPEVNISVGTNVDGIFNQIKSFVDSYNEMLDMISGKLKETVYRDFRPLVQDEKDGMTEKEIEQWEQKAKSGNLRNDEGLNRTLQGLRADLYQNVDGLTGSFKNIMEIGITTGNYREGGKLVIDEGKLRDAISADPEGVMDLFFKAPDSSKTGDERKKESGIIQRMYDGVVSGMKEVIRKSGTGDNAALLRSVQGNILSDFVSTHSSISLIDHDLRGLNSRISREEAILSRREDRYWAQFTAMEKAMNQMQQQSMWLMSQMGM